MNRIDRKFSGLKKKKKKALVVYICAGDPELKFTEKLVLELDKSGVDIIELGIPFSDPLADGPTIQRASQRALKNKVNLDKIFSMVRSLRKKTDMPIVLMGYYNPIFDYKVERFVKNAKASGCDGIIVPDLIPEEAGLLISSARECDFNTIFLAAPTSKPKRLRLIAERSAGFIYYVSLAGVTGARKTLASHIRGHIKGIRRFSKKPVCVGFGVSTPKQVKSLSSFCDGVIVGSAVINRIEDNLPDKRKAMKEVVLFVKKLVKGLR